MRLCEVIEELHLDQITPTDNQTGELIDCYSDKQWRDLADLFLRGIGKQHSVPGKVVHNFMGILDWYREHEHLTRDQKFYIFHRSLAFWHNLGCEMRASLVL